MLGLALVAGLLSGGGGASASSVPPTIKDLPTSARECEDLGYAYGFKIDPPQSGTYTVPGAGSITVTSTDPGSGLLDSWSSTFGIDAVYMKGGNQGGQAYAYSPEATSDTNLLTPDNTGSGKPAGISHVTFCYDFELAVTKTAVTSLDRRWTWTIDKSAERSSLTLATGQTVAVKYAVKVTVTKADANHAVSGSITIVNPDPSNPATVSGVSDAVSGFGAVTVSCNASFPVTLAPNASLVCTYSAGLPDGASRINTATATVSAGSKVGGGSGTAAVDFTKATVKETDESITINDSLVGSLGTVSASEAPKTIDYSYNASYPTCGSYALENKATFTANDTGANGTSGVSIGVTVPCDTGCTLTQGYWKTHSQAGPAPYDDTWLKIGGTQEKTAFFLSGQSWLGVFKTPPAGNPYYQLAHQYEAAKLNILNGASSTMAVTTAISGAESFLVVNAPTVKLTAAQRSQLLAWAGTLGAYNEGRTGPGHCSE